MLRTIKNLAISLLLTLVIAALSVLIITILADKNIISSKTNDYIIMGISCFLFFFFGFIFGKKQKKRGFLWGLFISSIYVGIACIYRFGTNSMTPLCGTMLAIRSVILILGAIIGTNRASKKEQLSA